MNLRSRTVRAIALGVAFGVWCWGWAELLGRAAVAWVEPGLAQQTPALASRQAFLRAVAESFGVPAPIGWGWAVGLAVAGGLLGWAAAVLVRVLRLDPRNLSGESIRWGPGWQPAVVWLCLVLVILFAALVLPITDSPALEILGLGSSLLASIVLASAVLSPVYASGFDRRWWLPRWPGLSVFLTWLLLPASGGLLIYSLDATIEAVSWRGVLLGLVSLVVGFFAYALAFHILVERLTPVPLWRRARKLARIEQLGPWLVLNAKLALVFLLFSIPAIVAFVWLWRVAPALAQWAQTQRGEIDLELQWARSGLAFMERYRVFLFGPPALLLVCAVSGRLVYLLRESNLESDVPEEEPL